LSANVFETDEDINKL